MPSKIVANTLSHLRDGGGGMYIGRLKYIVKKKIVANINQEDPDSILKFASNLLFYFYK
jgi:hypothetical protein